MKGKVIARLELYEQVWTTPMRRLCVEYGLSDNGLRKICKSLSVPVPPVGYWAKKAHGKQPPTPPLPRNPKLTEYVVTPEQQRKKTALSGEADAALKVNLADEALPENRITVVQPRKWHPAIAGFRNQVLDRVQSWKSRRRQGAKMGGGSTPAWSVDIRTNRWIGVDQHTNLIGPLTHKTSPFRVLVDDHERALLILDAVCKAGETRGYRAEPLVKDSERLILLKEGVRIQLRITSISLRRMQPDTRFNGLFSHRMRRVSEPTARLKLSVGLYSWTERHFTDSDDSRLEDQLNSLFIHIHRLTATQLEKRRAEAEAEERREKKRIAWEAEKARLEEERRLAALAKAEKERIEQERLARENALIAEAARWHQALDLSMYLEHVKGAQAQQPVELISWISWAEEVATRLDPTRDRLACFGGPQDHVKCDRPAGDPPAE